MPPTGKDTAGVEEKQPIPWHDDKLVLKCTRCEVPFSFFKRKHHCRACGQVFCADCTKDYAILPHVKEKQRVCVFCKAMIDPPAPRSISLAENDTVLVMPWCGGCDQVLY